MKGAASMRFGRAPTTWRICTGMPSPHEFRFIWEKLWGTGERYWSCDGEKTSCTSSVRLIDSFAQYFTYLIHLFFRHVAEERHRERGGGHALGVGEIARHITETLPVERLQVNWSEIRAAGNASLIEPLDDLIPLNVGRKAQNVNKPTGAGSGWGHERRGHALYGLQP